MIKKFPQLANLNTFYELKKQQQQQQPQRTQKPQKLIFLIEIERQKKANKCEFLLINSSQCLLSLLFNVYPKKSSKVLLPPLQLRKLVSRDECLRALGNGSYHPKWLSISI